MKSTCATTKDIGSFRKRFRCVVVVVDDVVVRNGDVVGDGDGDVNAVAIVIISFLILVIQSRKNNHKE